MKYLKRWPNRLDSTTKSESRFKLASNFLARAEDIDVDIAPIFNVHNENYRQKFIPPPLPAPLNELEQEAQYRKARKEKELKKRGVIDKFNNKYQKKYDELELQVQNLAKQGSDYGRQIMDR